MVGLARPLCDGPAAPQRILDGHESLDDSENRLRMGPAWFDPNFPFSLLKALNGFAVVSWYYQQIRRLSDGDAPDPKLGVLSSLVREQWTQNAHHNASAKISAAAKNNAAAKIRGSEKQTTGR